MSNSIFHVCANVTFDDDREPLTDNTGCDS
mgnify:CR=1 FL=1